MSKNYYSLGLMSGTSMDGVDASVIQTDGKSSYKPILDKYFEYPKDIFKSLTALRDKIISSKDLKKKQHQIKSLEKKITIFHAKVVNDMLKKKRINIDFVGFHGQTIFHKAEEKITKQLGDGKLLSKLTNKKVVYDLRKNDLRNGGQGAPLTPIFHKLLIDQYKIKTPVIILNIGGITNFTLIYKDLSPGQYSSVNWKNKKWTKQNCLFAGDTGPGNCLIDQWIRKHSKKLFDKNGKIAKSGIINKTIIKDVPYVKLQDSYDVKDFTELFYHFNKLSFKDGAASLTEYTAASIIDDLDIIFKNNKWNKNLHFLISGGGRKNNFLIERIKKKTKKKIKLIDDLKINGDFVESQAFAYLAVRSYLKLPISFPETTGCKKPITGGKIIKFK